MSVSFWLLVLMLCPGAWGIKLINQQHLLHMDWRLRRGRTVRAYEVELRRVEDRGMA